MHKIPVIDVTDLYHPYQDPGDNVDLLTAYALPEIDLRAVILDATDSLRQVRYRHPLFGEMAGPRDPGVIPVTQCNYLFGRRVPCGIGPFRPMRSPADRMEGLSPFYNGVDLLLQTLRASRDKVHILCFGSARAIAVAFNREPELFSQQVEAVHLSAGSSGGFLEWNVELDVHAFVCLLRSGLPVYLYPCATEKGPFDYGEHNTYWRLSDPSFFAGMAPPLRRYLAYAFSKSREPDFLRVLEEGGWEEGILQAPPYHEIWETAIWMHTAGRKLYQAAEGFRYLPEEPGRIPALTEELLPVSLQVFDTGLFTFAPARESEVRLYRRSLPEGLAGMLEDAYRSLYLSYEASLPTF